MSGQNGGDRLADLDRIARAYGELSLAVGFTDGVEGDAAKRITGSWNRTKPLTDAGFAAGLMARCEKHNPAIVLGASGLIGIDIDGREGLELFVKIAGTLPRTVTVTTGKGAHLWFRPPPGVNGVAAIEFGANGVTLKKEGYFIAPPGLHPSGAVYQFREDRAPWEVSIAELPVEALEEMRHAAGAHRKAGGARGTPGEPIREGGRRTALCSMAGAMRRRDMGEEAILAGLRAENAARCDPPLPDEEVAALARDFAARYEPAESVEPKRLKLRRLDVAAMMNTLPPEVPWIAEPMIVRGALTLLVGREGEGKSLIALSLAIAVASGEAVAGFHPKAGRVVYVDAENSPGEIHRRVRALGLDAVAAEQVRIHEAEGFDFRHDLDELERVVVEEKPALLILDSFRALWGGSENDSDAVGPVIDRLRNFGRRHDAATLLLHHSGKVGSEYRGSTAIGAGAELIFSLAREPDDEDEQRRYLACRKSRPAPEPGRRWLRLSTDLGLTFVEECEAPTGADEAKPGRPAKARRELSPKILAALEQGPLNQSDIARACNRNPSDGSIRRVLDELVRQGKIGRREGRFYPLPNCQTPKGPGNLASPSGGAS